MDDIWSGGHPSEDGVIEVEDCRKVRIPFVIALGPTDGISMSL